MDRKPASAKSFIRCPECLRKLPNHTAQCPINEQGRKMHWNLPNELNRRDPHEFTKTGNRTLTRGLDEGVPRRDFLKKLALSGALLGVGGAGYFLGEGHAIPAPSIGSTVEPGSMRDTASYLVYIDGSTILSRNGATGQNQYSGSAAEVVIQASLDALTPGGGAVYVASGLYLLNKYLLVKPPGGVNQIVPSIFGEWSGGGNEVVTDPNGPVVFQPTSSFPNGEYHLAYLPSSTSLVQNKGAIILGLNFVGSDAGATKRAAGINLVNARQFRVSNNAIQNTITPSPTNTTVGENATAAFNVAEPFSAGGFCLFDNNTVSGPGQDGFFCQNLESTFVACRVIKHLRYGFNISPGNLALLGCMVDSGGNTGQNSPQIIVNQSNGDDTRIIGLNSFAGNTGGGPTIEVGNGTPNTGHPVFTNCHFWGPQTAGLGDIGAIVKLDGASAAEVDFMGCDFTAVNAATSYFVRALSGWTGKCLISGGRFNQTPVTAKISNAGTGVIKCRDVGNFNPLGFLANTTFGTSPWTYTNNDFVTQDVYIDPLTGTISAITKGGQSILPPTLTNAKATYITTLEPGEAIIITWATAAGTLRTFGK